MALVSHWDAERHPEWATQQSAFVLGFPVNDETVVSKVNEVQRSLDHNYLDQVPTADLFITVVGLGNAEVTSRDQAVALGREVAGGQREPLEFSCGVAAVFGESVLSFVDPVEQVEAMQEKAAATVGRFNRISLVVPTFPAHFTLAWVNREGPSAELASSLAEFPVDGLGTMTMTELCLLRVSRQSRSYEVQVVERFPFKGAAEASAAAGGKKPLWKRLFR